VTTEYKGFAWASFQASDPADQPAGQQIFTLLPFFVSPSFLSKMENLDRQSPSIATSSFHRFPLILATVLSDVAEIQGDKGLLAERLRELCFVIELLDRTSYLR